jgi:hypothetical protein
MKKNVQENADPNMNAIFLAENFNPIKHPKSTPYN